MGRLIRTIIMDDNVDFCIMLSDNLKRYPDFDVVGLAHNGIEGLDMVTKYEPDLIILDIIMPYLDGLDVLDKIKDMSLQNRPMIMMLSCIGRDKILKRAMESGASYYLIKPFDIDILVKRVYEFLYDDDNKSDVNSISDTKKSSFNRNKIESKVMDLLLKLGMQPNIKGYSFLKTGIALIVEDPSKSHNFTKKLYPEISKYYDSTPSRVERAIRHAIESTWSNGDIDNINAAFGYTVGEDKGKPTNGQFIAMVSDKMMLEND